MIIDRGARIGWLAGPDEDPIPLIMGETVLLPGCAGLLYSNEMTQVITVLFIIYPSAIASGIHFRTAKGPVAGAFLVQPQERFSITRDGREAAYVYETVPLEIRMPDGFRCDFCHARDTVCVLVQNPDPALAGTNVRCLCRDCAVVFGNYRQ